MDAIVSEILTRHGVSPDSASPSQYAPHVLNIKIPGEAAISVWQDIQSRFSETGVWPIIRGDAEDVIDEFPCNPVETLERVPAGTAITLLEPRLQERIDMYGDSLQGLPEKVDIAQFASLVDASGMMSFSGSADDVEPWPSPRAVAELRVHSINNLRTGKLHRQILFALITLKHPFEAPAYLGFGGWNDAPMPELQVAMLREWHRVHGAVPIAMTGDVLECFVERPPQNESDAMALAQQQWIFCDDIVSQGTQSVRKLAIEIYQSPRWFFWWD